MKWKQTDYLKIKFWTLRYIKADTKILRINTDTYSEPCQISKTLRKTTALEYYCL